MTIPKVSVIVPVYNTEKYLRKCLDSLVNQTIGDIQVVIVNDGSKDSSLSIIREYAERYPDKISYQSQENRGQAVARNRAIGMCEGEYIGFLDSDDFVKTDMFQRMYDRAKETGADYVACGYTDLTYEEDKEIILQEYVASKPAYTTKDMFFGALASPFLHLYRRDILLNSGVLFPEGVIYEDTAFYLNLIPHLTKLAVIEESLAFRTRHSNSTMTTFSAKKVEQIFTVLDFAINYYKEQGFDQCYGAELEYFCVRVLLCSSLQRISRVQKSKDRKELKQKTLNYISEHFPQYRENPYFRGGMKNRYMKCFNKYTSGIYVCILRIKSRLERQYS